MSSNIVIIFAVKLYLKNSKITACNDFLMAKRCLKFVFVLDPAGAAHDTPQTPSLPFPVFLPLTPLPSQSLSLDW